jgi:hypothetical protein
VDSGVDCDGLVTNLVRQFGVAWLGKANILLLDCFGNYFPVFTNLEEKYNSHDYLQQKIEPKSNKDIKLQIKCMPKRHAVGAKTMRWCAD